MRQLTSLHADERGQATSEYAITIVVVTMIVGLFVAVVKSGVLEEQFQDILSGLVERVLP